MSKKEQIRTIGKAELKKEEKLKEWIISGEAAKVYHEHWQKLPGSDIGFYSLQSLIPCFHEAADLYDKSWGKRRLEDLLEITAYYRKIGQSLQLLYVGYGYTVIKAARESHVWLVPEEYVTYTLFKDYDSLPGARLSLMSVGSGETSLLPAGLNDCSVNSTRSQLKEKEAQIKEQWEKLKAEEDKKKEELEKFRQELELKYKDKFDLLNRKKAELEEASKKLKNQMFMLETQIYAIRCFFGEVIEFTKLADGRCAPEDTPVVIYQKIRFLDEELGKLMSVYDVDGDDTEYFEQIIAARNDIRDIFAPAEKCVTLIKISRSGVRYTASERFANVLKKYEKFHGGQIGILIRNGDCLYMGWTDDEMIYISGENAFFKNNVSYTSVEDDESEASSTKEDVVSRYFIYSILQGLIENGTILSIPEKVNLLKQNPYVILSAADGWLKDNRFGTFSDIVERTAGLPLREGDMVLTTQHITRDDTYSSRNNTYNNDRGRGEKNRTHDVSLSDCTAYPINLVDREDLFVISILRYPVWAEQKVEKITETTSTSHMEYGDVLQGPSEILQEKLCIENGYFHEVRVYDAIKRGEYELIGNLWREFHKEYCGRLDKPVTEYFFGGQKSFIETYYGIEYTGTKYPYFISEEKRDSRYSRTKARANFEIYPRDHEMLNLTYLNSVYVRYAIMNREMGTWYVENYAASIRYLNKALAYLTEREKTEEVRLSKYMELYPDWQVDVSEWRLKNGYHNLTETRAKKFAKERKNK